MTEQVTAEAQKAECTNGETTASPRRGLGRWAGIGVFAAVALPIVSAYTVFYTGLGMPTDTVNQGELLQPARSVEALALLSTDGEEVLFPTDDAKWRYLILADERCGEACEKLLYTTRQIHIRLGEKARRVERVLVTPLPLSAGRQQTLHKLHPKMRFAAVDNQQITQWLSETSHAGLNAPSALLVDQRGYAMMVYDNGNTGNQLLKDIKRLLKYSYEQ